MIRILHVSDLHFGAEHVAALEAVHDYAKNTPVDLIAITGDLTQYGRQREFAAAARWIARLPTANLSTPGNHDTPHLGVVSRVFRPFSRYVRTIGPAAHNGFVKPGLHARALNTARGVQLRLDWSKGVVNLMHLRLALTHLNEAIPDTLKVLVCHHPLMETAGAPMSARVRRGHEAAQMTAEAGVDLVLSGHVHAPFVEPLPFADRHSYMVGAGTLSVRGRGALPGFNLIEADAATITVNAMGFTGADFEQQNRWVQPRRKA